MNPLHLHILYRRAKFLEDSNSFLLVHFLATPQSGFVELKETLFEKGLQLKVIKSRSIFPLISTMIHHKFLNNITNLSRTPVFLIQNFKKGQFLDKVNSLDFSLFSKYSMYFLIGFNNGVLYKKDLFLNFEYKFLYNESISLFYFIFFKMFLYKNMKNFLLIKLFYIYNKEYNNFT